MSFKKFTNSSLTEFNIKFVKKKVLHISLIYCRVFLEILDQFLYDLLIKSSVFLSFHLHSLY